MPSEMVLADNDTNLRSRLRDMLLDAGHNVECLSDHNEIISRVRAKRPHLLIVDKDLAPAGGIQVAREARELDRDLKIALLAKDNLSAEDKPKALLLNVRGIKKDLDGHFTLKALLKISLEINDKVEESRHFHLGRVLLVDDNVKIRTSLKIFLKTRGLDVREAADGRQALSRVYAERPRLVVNDQKDQCDCICGYFSERNFSVVKAMTGIEAIVLVRNRRPDIVLLDFSLGGIMDGRNVLSEIRVYDQSLKVIIITGGTLDEEEMQEIVSLGVVGLIPKPVDLPGLETAIRDSLGTGRKGPLELEEARAALRNAQSGGISLIRLRHELANICNDISAQCELYLLNTKEGFYKDKNCQERLDMAVAVINSVLSSTLKLAELSRKIKV